MAATAKGEVENQLGVALALEGLFGFGCADFGPG
jgi:hypothetical protein